MREVANTNLDNVHISEIRQKCLNVYEVFHSQNIFYIKH